MSQVSSTLDKPSQSNEMSFGIHKPPVVKTLLKTHTELEFLVRPARPDDRQGLAFLFSQLTPEDIHFRFLTPLHRVPNDVREQMTHVDHIHVENFLAFDRDTNVPIASAMLAADDQMEEAEVALAVHSHFKHKGVSWTLLNYVTEQARAKGIKRLRSLEHRSHSAAIELQREMGFTARAYPEDQALILLERDLTAPVPVK